MPTPARAAMAATEACAPSSASTSRAAWSNVRSLRSATSLRVAITTDHTSRGAIRSGTVARSGAIRSGARRCDMTPDVEAIERVVRDAEELQSDVAGFTGLLTDEVSLVNFAGIR